MSPVSAPVHHVRSRRCLQWGRVFRPPKPYPGLSPPSRMLPMPRRSLQKGRKSLSRRNADLMFTGGAVLSMSCPDLKLSAAVLSLPRGPPPAPRATAVSCASSVLLLREPPSPQGPERL